MCKQHKSKRQVQQVECEQEAEHTVEQEAEHTVELEAEHTVEHEVGDTQMAEDVEDNFAEVQGDPT